MPLLRRRSASVCVVLCLVPLSLAASGCGGKSVASSSTHGGGTESSTAASATSQTSSAPVSPSAKPFIARADPICHEENVRLARSAKVKSQQPQTVATTIKGNQAIEQQALGQLTELKPPSELAGAWKTMLEYRGALARQLGAYATAVGSGVKSFSSLAASKRKLHAELLATGHKAGFNDCAKIG